VKNYHEKQLVFLLSPRHTGLNASLKLSMSYLGPLYIYAKLNDTTFKLATIDNKLLPGKYHISRLKHAFIRGKSGLTITDIDSLRKDHFNVLHTIIHLPNLTKVAQTDQAIELQVPESSTEVAESPKDTAKILNSKSDFISCFVPLEDKITTVAPRFEIEVDSECVIKKWRWRNGQLEACLVPYESHMQIYNKRAFENHYSWFSVEQYPMLAYLPGFSPQFKHCTGSFSKFRQQMQAMHKDIEYY
jgi:hypothetical protein